MLTYGGEDGPDMGKFEQVANTFANVDEFDGAACGPGGDIEPHQSAKAHAVHGREIGQIKDDPSRTGYELAGIDVKNIGCAGYELAMASNECRRAVMFNVEREEWSGGVRGHLASFFSFHRHRRQLSFRVAKRSGPAKAQAIC
jgi:hypothetical protein